jgi:hypothetical protein
VTRDPAVRVHVEGVELRAPGCGRASRRRVGSVTAAHQRGARRERQTAALVDGVRVIRPRGESAPDVEPVTLPSGVVILPESKARRKPLATAERWLRQAEGYLPGAVGVVFVYATGQRVSDGLVILRASAFRRIAGLEAPDAQPPLPFAKGGR